MTDCPNGEIRDLLPDLLHGRLDASDRTRAEEHVASCDDCRAELSLLRDLRSTLRRAPAIDATAIAAAIPAYRAPVRHRGWGGWRAAAAIAAIAVGGTSITLVNHERGTAPVTREVDVLPKKTSPHVPPVAISTPSEPGGQTPAGAERIAPDVAPASGVTEPVSLAMTGGATGELSDRELSTLLNEIDTLDALPSEDVEGAGAVELESTR
ncbi:MAG TPA: zf-HC2 domain-containing protein [Gemmatimonadaceae bacterium]|nr:zf-HC2 domain-containing protein [Gemmatimonadaceae bacterium]